RPRAVWRAIESAGELGSQTPKRSLWPIAAKTERAAALSSGSMVFSISFPRASDHRSTLLPPPGNLRSARAHPCRQPGLRRDQPFAIDAVEHEVIDETGLADPDAHPGSREIGRDLLDAQDLLVARRIHRRGRLPAAHDIAEFGRRPSGQLALPHAV